MKAKLIIVGIDDIARLFGDYLSLTDWPSDAKCDTLLYNKQLNKMCLRIQSDSWMGRMPPEVIKFDLRKTWLA